MFIYMNIYDEHIYAHIHEYVFILCVIYLFIHVHTHTGDLLEWRTDCV